MKNKRKIAFIANTMCVGGVERALIELLKNLDYNRFNVTLYLRNSHGEFLSEIDERVNIKYWGSIRPDNTLYSLIKKGRILPFLKGLYNRFLARIHSKDWALNELYAVRSLPTDTVETYDCIIAYHGATVGALSFALYRLKGYKRIVWIHGRDPFPDTDRHIFEREYRKFNKVICVSASIERIFSDCYPSVSCKTSVIYNLIDQNIILDQASKDNISLPSISILTVGRLAGVKGQQMIPKTSRMLVDAGYDIHWYLVGDGPLREDVEREIEKYAVSDRVILLGTQTNPYPYIKNCDIYVQTSLSEGYCTTTVEAKILQKPIVTTDAPGMREQFASGENGLIVDEMTPEALFDGIKMLLDHPEMRKKFIENLKHERYDNSKELQKLYDFIKN